MASFSLIRNRLNSQFPTMLQIDRMRCQMIHTHRFTFPTNKLIKPATSLKVLTNCTIHQIVILGTLKLIRPDSNGIEQSYELFLVIATKDVNGDGVSML